MLSVDLQECVVDLYRCSRADCTYHCILLPGLFGLGGHLANEVRNGSAGLVDHTAEDPVFSRQRARKSAQFCNYVYRAILFGPVERYASSRQYPRTNCFGTKRSLG
ncbi:hypothetical protein [Streptomyces canus]|uniref:hypothetical protein n=1 Tax=Streptomyces canus TaxID=58343 RepID=UPI0033BE2B5C